MGTALFSVTGAQGICIEERREEWEREKVRGRNKGREKKEKGKQERKRGRKGRRQEERRKKENQPRKMERASRPRTCHLPPVQASF